MKNLFNIVIAVLGIYISNGQPTELGNNFLKKSDTISYKSIGFNNYREIILLHNADFIRIENNISDYGGKSTFEKHYGKYELSDSILRLKPERVELKTYTGKPEQKSFTEVFDYNLDSEKKITTVFILKNYKSFLYLIPAEYDIKKIRIEKLSDIIRKRLFSRRIVNETTD